MIKHLGSSSSGNGHLVQAPSYNGPVLLDAGVSVHRMRDEIKLTDLHGALISHEHGDHSRSVPQLLDRSVRVFMSRGTMESLGITHHRIKLVEAGDKFAVGNYRVKALEAEHDANEPLGFVVMGRGIRVLYLNDTSFSRYTFKGLTHFLIECNYSKKILLQNVELGTVSPYRRDRVYKNHFALNDVIDFLKESDLTDTKEIHLLHLSDDNADPESFLTKVQREVGVPTFIAKKHGGKYG